MAVEIEFSVMSENAGSLRRLLDRFEAENNARVHLRLLEWPDAWNALVRSALYNDGLDLSEVGTTWTGDLIGMNALRPFEAHEIMPIERQGAFLPAAWKAAFPDDGRAWSMPWMSGSRVLLYRPALLAEAGIDPAATAAAAATAAPAAAYAASAATAAAFATPAALDSTLTRLRACGLDAPWTFEGISSAIQIHNLATWLWAEGGDFVHADGKSVAFLEPAALEGLRSFFRLFRHADLPALKAGASFETSFLNNPRAAVAMVGTWMFGTILGRDDLRDSLAVALPPGPAFVGGSNLVVWKNSRHPEMAVRLVRYLLENGPQVAHSRAVGLMPVRLPALQSEPYASEPFWQVAAQALLTGRSFPAVRLWGLVEDRLRPTLDAITREVLANPSADPQDALLRHLGPLRQRINLLLNSK